MERFYTTLKFILAPFWKLAPDTVSERLAPPVTTADTGNEQPSRPISTVDEHTDLPKSGPYLYRPLNGSHNEIRILALHASPEEEAPIRCDLLHVPLDPDGDSPRFYALSYTWGTLEKRASITIEGHQFPVTQNLEAALRRMRSWRTETTRNTVARAYWRIDAICINQADDLERNQQVALMTRIYKKCSGVQVWLGEEADNSAMAMSLANKLSTRNLSRGPGEPRMAYPEVSTEEKIMHWEALIALFQRPWWERVWIRQEVMIPQSVTVHCGASRCSFYALGETAQLLDQVTQQLSYSLIQHHVFKVGSDLGAFLSTLTTSCFRRASVLYSLRQQISPDKFLNFKELVFHARRCKATDPRDKVFAMLGLVDQEIYSLSADYGLSLNSVYAATVLSLLSTTRRVDFLSACQNPERLNGLQSWMPNLVDAWKAQPFKQGRNVNRVSREIAHYVLEEESGAYILRIRGCCLDAIAAVSDDTPQESDTAEQLDAIYESWKALAATALKNPKLDCRDRWYIEDKLFGRQNDQSWIEFLSIDSNGGDDMLYYRDKKSLLLGGPSITTSIDMGMAKSLLLPDESDGVLMNSPRLWIRKYMRMYGVGRRLGISKKGIVGLVPADARPKDVICLFRGAAFPYVLRRNEKERYVVVGEARESISPFPFSVANFEVMNGADLPSIAKHGSWDLSVRLPYFTLI